MGMGWPVGLPQVGLVCANVRMLEGYLAIVGWLDMFGFLFWFGVAGGRLLLPGFQSRLWEQGGRLQGKVGTVMVCGGAS